MRALMRFANGARGGPVETFTNNLNNAMLEIFQISLFDEMFPVHDSVDAAITG